MTSGPAGESGMFSLFRSQLINHLNSICNLNSPLPCKVPNSQVPETVMCTAFMGSGEGRVIILLTPIKAPSL